MQILKYCRFRIRAKKPLESVLPNINLEIKNIFKTINAHVSGDALLEHLFILALLFKCRIYFIHLNIFELFSVLYPVI